MKKRTAFFLAIILVLSNMAFLAHASGGVPEWAEAYTDYVKYGQFFQESIDFLSSNVSVALHDMDADGIPELLITNGAEDRAQRCAYAFSIRDHKVKCLGIAPTDAFVSHDPACPGLFGYYNLGDHISWTYYWIEDVDTHSWQDYEFYSEFGLGEVIGVEVCDDYRDFSGQMERLGGTDAMLNAVEEELELLEWVYRDPRKRPNVCQR